jgi:hypothetical protein
MPADLDKLDDTSWRLGQLRAAIMAQTPRLRAAEAVVEAARDFGQYNCRAHDAGLHGDLCRALAAYDAATPAPEADPE